jgi:hypothetical protein
VCVAFAGAPSFALIASNTYRSRSRSAAVATEPFPNHCLSVDAMMLIRSAEERAGGKLGRAEKQKAGAAGLMALDQKQLHHQTAADRHQQQQASSSKPKLEMPRIYTTLSRKEKEEDFLAMKGTKLPVRPKRRPKAVEKAVNVRIVHLSSSYC